MPINFSYDYNTKAAERRKSAEAKVREKFPNIIEGSSGWYRAVANRMKRTP